eukprot:COSAG06_NODE_70120_length_193_cov_1139.765957_1_plen_21_part_10
MPWYPQASPVGGLISKATFGK